MSFFKAGTAYLQTVQNFNDLSDKEKAEATALLQAYEKIMKANMNVICALDLHLLLRLTETGLAIRIKDVELADRIFRSAIELSPYNKLVLTHYSEFLNIRGWDLESIQLKSFIEDDDLEKAQLFVNALTTFVDGHPVNTSRTPGALTAHVQHKFISVFSYLAKQYLDEIHAALDNDRRLSKKDLAWLDDKMKLFIPCIAKKDLPILHEFTQKGLAKYIPNYDVAFRLFQKNLEMEPHNENVARKFYSLLMKKKLVFK